MRAFVLGSRANLANVTVKVEGFANGASLGTVALTGPTSPPVAEVLAVVYRAAERRGKRAGAA